AEHQDQQQQGGDRDEHGTHLWRRERGGGKRRVDMRAVMNGVMYILSTGRGTYQKTFRRAARCMTILRGGFATARWIGSIMHCTSNAARRRSERPAPPLASSTARA